MLRLPRVTLSCTVDPWLPSSLSPRPSTITYLLHSANHPTPPPQDFTDADSAARYGVSIPVHRQGDVSVASIASISTHVTPEVVAAIPSPLSPCPLGPGDHDLTSHVPILPKHTVSTSACVMPPRKKTCRSRRTSSSRSSDHRPRTLNTKASVRRWTDNVRARSQRFVLPSGYFNCTSIASRVPWFVIAGGYPMLIPAIRDFFPPLLTGVRRKSRARAPSGSGRGRHGGVRCGR